MYVVNLHLLLSFHQQAILQPSVDRLSSHSNRMPMVLTFVEQVHELRFLSLRCATRMIFNDSWSIMELQRNQLVTCFQVASEEHKTSSDSNSKPFKNACDFFNRDFQAFPFHQMTPPKGSKWRHIVHMLEASRPQAS